MIYLVVFPKYKFEHSKAIKPEQGDSKRQQGFSDLLAATRVPLVMLRGVENVDDDTEDQGDDEEADQ